MRTLLTALLIAILFSSCKKDDHVLDFTHGKISSSLYPFLFDTGSYWIYKDTVTNSIDSMIVTSIGKEIYTYPVAGPGEGSPGDEEYFHISYLSYPTNTVSDNYLTSSQIGTTIPVGYGEIKYISTKNIGETAQNATIVAILDSLNVEGQMYYNVVKIKSLPNSSSVIINYYYYVENIGLIKRQALIPGTGVDKTWNLLRYNAIIKPYF